MGGKKKAVSVKVKKASVTGVSRQESPPSSTSKKRHDKAKKGKQYSGGATWQQLSVLGLKIREVTADGNCFFRAVADQLEGSQASHAELRAKTVDYIQSHEAEFQPFVEDDVSFLDYCGSMREDGTWAGHLELQALALLTRCNICIHRLGEPRWHIRNFQDPRTRTLHISYHDGEHYNSVRREDDDTYEPAKPILIESDAQAGSNPPPPKDNIVDPRKSGRGEGISEADIRQVSAGTGCMDSDRIRQVLRETGGDVEAAVEYLVAAGSRDEAEAEGGAEDRGTEGGERESVGGSGDPREEDSKSHADAAEPSVARDGTTSGGRSERTRGSAGGGPGIRDAPSSGHQRLGRNQSCPCGSKKKYKACCGAAQRPHPLTQGDEQKETKKERQARSRQDQHSTKSDRKQTSHQSDEVSRVADVGSLCI